MVYKPVYLNMYYCCCILHLSQCGVDATKRGGLRPCIKSHGNYIVNHGVVFLSFSGNPVSGEKHSAALQWSPFTMTYIVNRKNLF